MRVIVERKAIVPDVLRGIRGLGHTADGENGKHVFLSFPFDVLEHAVEALVDFLRAALGVDFVAETHCDEREVCQLFRVGIVMRTR